jgi:hypothetical protein
VPPHTDPVPGEAESHAGGFITLDSDAQLHLIFGALIGKGPLEFDTAIRMAADHLRRTGAADYQRLRSGGDIYNAIESAITHGVRQGRFDRPRRGRVRAILPDPKDYDREKWRTCLLHALDGESTDRDEALRAAADWAAENMGLVFSRLRSDGVIMEGLRSALNSAIRKGEVERVGATSVRKAGGGS